MIETLPVSCYIHDTFIHSPLKNLLGGVFLLTVHFGQHSFLKHSNKYQLSLRSPTGHVNRTKDKAKHCFYVSSSQGMTLHIGGCVCWKGDLF